MSFRDRPYKAGRRIRENYGNVSVSGDVVTVTLGQNHTDPDTSFSFSTQNIDIPTDDPNATPHYYSDTHVVGSIHDPLLDMDVIFDALRHDPASRIDPPFDQGPVETGDTSQVPFFGNVTHIVDQEGLTVVNVTHPDHDLHPGIVVRTIHTVDDHYVITTTGIGTGALPEFNELGSNPFWGNSVESIATQIALRNNLLPLDSRAFLPFPFSGPRVSCPLKTVPSFS